MNSFYITILITTYNCASYLKQAINSILYQSYENFELLIIDDGSDDNTSEIINIYKDYRIRYKKINHCGRSQALNYGLSIAKYDWISLMDADDIAHPLRLEKQISLLSGNENEICFTDAAFFKKDKLRFIIENEFGSKAIHEVLTLHGHFTNSTFLFNKNYIKKFGGYNESLKVYEDYDLWLRIKDKSEFIFVHEILQFQRIREGSLTNLNRNHLNEKFYEIQEPYYQDLKSSFSILEVDEQNQVIGWREFFYGNKNLCRYYWKKIKITKWDYKMLLAYLISFFPAAFVIQFNKLRVRLRLEYLFDKRKKFKGLDKEFRKLLKDVSR
jgi:glycosyltransferase involved in cell wall biosynthesis